MSATGVPVAYLCWRPDLAGGPGGLLNPAATEDRGQNAEDRMQKHGSGRLAWLEEVSVRVRQRTDFIFCLLSFVFGRLFAVLGRPGSDLLSHALRRSTIGAEGFHGRVRDGIGCGALAITTRPAKNRGQSSELSPG